MVHHWLWFKQFCLSESFGPNISSYVKRLQNPSVARVSAYLVLYKLDFNPLYFIFAIKSFICKKQLKGILCCLKFMLAASAQSCAAFPFLDFRMYCTHVKPSLNQLNDFPFYSIYHRWVRECSRHAYQEQRNQEKLHFHKRGKSWSWSWWLATISSENVRKIFPCSTLTRPSSNQSQAAHSNFLIHSCFDGISNTFYTNTCCRSFNAS